MNESDKTGAYVLIKRLSDGKVVLCRDEYWSDESGQFQWGDNNYSCDCNRHIFFHQAEGTEETDDDSCGDGKRYLVVIVTPSGWVALNEWENGHGYV